MASPTAGPLKGPEIVMAQQSPQGGSHGSLVQALAVVVPAPGRQEKIGRATVVEAEKQACQSSGTAAAALTRIEGGRRPLRAAAQRRAGIGPATSTWTTWPAAWTPLSVRPAATACMGRRGSSVPRALSRVPCTLL
jgi:hypothetical protein